MHPFVPSPLGIDYPMGTDPLLELPRATLLPAPYPTFAALIKCSGPRICLGVMSIRAHRVLEGEGPTLLSIEMPTGNLLPLVFKCQCGQEECQYIFPHEFLGRLSQSGLTNPLVITRTDLMSGRIGYYRLPDIFVVVPEM